MKTLLALARIGAGGFLFLVYSAITVPILLVLIPSRLLRIKVSNLWGSAAGSTAMFLSGCPLQIKGREALGPPALYVSNHTSVLDLFMGMWLSPTGTVGVAKKEIVWYPFLGQVYLVSGHLRVDRSNRERAVASLEELSGIVRRSGLSIFMWPEGTRSRTGRLLPFKKGFVHLAVATGLPVVPMVVRGAQRAWQASTFSVQPTPIEVEFLPPVDTSDWSVETMNDHLEEIYGIFWDAIPQEQRPEERHVFGA